MLGSMLGGAPNAVTVPESQFITASIRALATEDRFPDPPAALAFFRGHRRFRAEPWDIPAVHTPDLDALAAETDFAGLVEEIVRRFAAAVDRPDAPVWIDHTPENIRYTLLLRRLFPDARFVHLVRDPRAVAASMLQLEWGPTDVDDMARKWMVNLALGLTAEADFGPEVVRRVSYEDVVRDPEAVLRPLAAWLDLEYNPVMATGGRFEVPEWSRAQHRLVGRPPDPARLERWRETLTPRQIARIESITCDAQARLGYPLDQAMISLPATRRERLRATIRHLWHGEFTQPLRFRLRRARRRSGPPKA